MYLKQIKQLVILQKVDDQIIVLKQEMDLAPKELEDLENKMSGLEEKKTQIQEKLGMIKEQQTRLDTEIEEDSVKVKKSKNKLMMVGNTKEYHAMLREMDSLEKLNRMREEERVALVEEIGNLEESIKQVDNELAEVKTELDEKKAGLDERMKVTQKELEKLNDKRSGACDVVPKPILGRYEFIRERLSNPVIVPVDGGVCSGCKTYIHIPPQTYNDLQKGTQIISCPNCQRLIFWREHIPAEQPKKEEAEAAK